MNITEYPSRGQASLAAAGQLADQLRKSLATQDTATLVVSGGSTPVECFHCLSTMKLPWDDVDVTLSDERCVPPDHSASNTRMIRNSLLQNAAHCATITRIDQQTFEAPFSAVLLGMGEDGHFASIFPDAQERIQALDLAEPPAALYTSTAASEFRRQTLNLSALVYTPLLTLLAFGEPKRQLIESPTGLPVQALFDQQRSKLQVIWAP